MAGRAARRWRQIRLGAAFVEFGAAALAVAFLAAPVVRYRAGSEEEAELAVQRVIQRAYAFSWRFWERLGILRLHSRGLAGLEEQGACIVVANHPTLIDVVLLGSHLKQMDCIVNAGWTAKSPFLARAIDAAGFVRNDAGAAVVEACSARLERGRRLLVFPEGTRSPWGSFGKFHRGAAHIALASGAPIVAVAIRCRPRMLGSGRKWHDVAGAMSDFEMHIAGRLEPADYQRDGVSTPIAARRMTEDLLAIFLQEPNLADA
ncbi:MAG: lysophospholipid acyltransferase family protein [Candidatus Binatia bacterium]